MVDNFMKCKYAWEKFHGAVHSLASEGDLKTRLIRAYVFNITPLNRDNDIPKELLERYDEFVHLMTKVPAQGDEGSVAATVNKMDEIEMERATDLIIGLYDDLCRFMPNHYA
ncbi:hypothetical protein [Atlantibacter sp. RC6]|uniref:hypothetical protein n=1 Tax=Atlantibacter sp. RC6 TaxID=2587036 RepID=UPI001606733B|nr:hypothetical protein [Atlantibacter sp. RC6]MBB3324217.1 hypothetical protein [Atlantibacter sp. RC6]